jgi:hypothetical protein
MPGRKSANPKVVGSPQLNERGFGSTRRKQPDCGASQTPGAVDQMAFRDLCLLNMQSHYGSMAADDSCLLPRHTAGLKELGLVGARFQASELALKATSRRPRKPSSLHRK